MERKAEPGAKTRKNRRWRRAGAVLAFLVVLLVSLRLALPSVVRWYVNRALDRSLLYQGEIGTIHVHMFRGAYSIDDMRLLKVNGNLPVPLFSARRVDLALDSDGLLAGEMVGRITLVHPEINFVAAQEQSESQTGAGTPWMQVIQDLYPFDINSARIQDGSVHFRAFETDPPVDVYLTHVNGAIDNLTNIRDQTKPLVTTIRASALAMEQARVEYEMKMDPFSYRPTFELAVRLLGLDVRKLNSLTEAYGAFGMKSGWFDLVIQLKSNEGQLEGYVKPLFRQLEVFSLKEDLHSDNPLEFFWQALVGVTTQLFKNQERDQFGTVIPFRGDVSDPQTDILAVIGNVLRNAFVRAYLPRLGGSTPDINGLEFGTGSITNDPSTMDGP